MTDMPKRDTTGNCQGDCKDKVKEMEKDQQKKIDQEDIEGSTGETPSVDNAKNRNNAPGEMGGHV
jgi:hypothetical protein